MNAQSETHQLNVGVHGFNLKLLLTKKFKTRIAFEEVFFLSNSQMFTNMFENTYYSYFQFIKIMCQVSFKIYCLWICNYCIYYTFIPYNG